MVDWRHSFPAGFSRQPADGASETPQIVRPMEEPQHATQPQPDQVGSGQPGDREQQAHPITSEGLVSASDIETGTAALQAARALLQPRRTELYGHQPTSPEKGSHRHRYGDRGRCVFVLCLVDGELQPLIRSESDEDVEMPKQSRRSRIKCAQSAARLTLLTPVAFPWPRLAPQGTSYAPI